MKKFNEVMVITGASNGIGAALALKAAAAGKKLVLADINFEKLQTLANQMPVKPLVLQTDVRMRADVDRIVNEALNQFGQIDIWINNVGRGINKSVLDLTDQDFDEMMTVNTKSALYAMQAVIPHFKQRGLGHFLVISSFLGKVPRTSFRSAYSAAKAALNSLLSNLRMDLATAYPQIYVSTILPSVVQTDFAKHAIAAAPTAVPKTSAVFAPQTPNEVADQILTVLANPCTEFYTNPNSHKIVQRYYADVGECERWILSH